MIYFVYGWKSKMQNCFARPFYQLEAPDVSLTMIKRQIQTMQLKDIKKFNDMDLYCLATFDDETGEYRNCNQLVLSYDSLTPVIKFKEKEAELASQEVKKDE